MNVSKTEDNSEAIQKSLDEILSMEILIGIPEDASAREAGGTTNSEIGYTNEFGSPIHNIPARPHLIPGVEASRSVWNKLMGQALARAMNRQNGEAKLEEAGSKAASSVKNTIIMGEGYAPPSNFTMAMRKKGNYSSDKPLIVTGEYLDSITYAVVEKKDGSS